MVQRNTLMLYEMELVMNTMGIAEFRSIGEGTRATDDMVKRGAVEILWARTMCPGKFLTILTGDVAAVEEALAQGHKAKDHLVSTCLLSAVHPAIAEALRLRYDPGVYGSALGLLESTSVAQCIKALDKALKAADVKLHKLVPGMGIGGKAYFILTGEVSAVEHAIEAGKQAIPRGKLISAIVLPAPDKLLLESFGI